MRSFLIGAFFATMFTVSSHAQESKSAPKQYFEFRNYRMATPEAAAALDQHIGQALIPALNRAGCTPVGYFKPFSAETAGERYLLVPYASLDQMSEVRQKLAQDEAFQEAFKTYSSRDPKEIGLERIRSEVLLAFDCFPQVKVPELTSANQDRLFELRTYESATEHLGNVKVEMFNSGEVPIFLDCGIAPVFMGQAIVGDRLPNLTYMTVYPNAEAKAECWKKFREHPDWKKMSGEARWKNTVSKIHMTDLLSAPGSQL